MLKTDHLPGLANCSVLRSEQLVMLALTTTLQPCQRLNGQSLIAPACSRWEGMLGFFRAPPNRCVAAR